MEGKSVSAENYESIQDLYRRIERLDEIVANLKQQIDMLEFERRHER